MQLEIGEFFESVNDALNAAITALGGFKKVGPRLRPELSEDTAAQWLRDCVNAGRREKLSPEQFLLILRMAHDAGFHSVMNYIGFTSGYRAHPIDPETQESQLQEKFIEAVQGLTLIQQQLARVQKLRSA